MNWRKPAYLTYASWRGYQFPSLLAHYSRDYERGAGYETATRALAKLLRHCEQFVPYYAESMRQFHDLRLDEVDPSDYLPHLPMLRKETIRREFDQLRSVDLAQRQWIYNTSGGSTGEPVRLIQDREYEDRCKAITLLCLAQMKCDVGQPIVRLWGSERDLEGRTQSPKARVFNWLTNTTWLNAFHMSPQRMREWVATLNQLNDYYLLAYAQATYELARFAERERLPLTPPRAVITSAGTLYPFMRETIARVFGCPIYNLYGSREVSIIGCELPGMEGLWVPPWGTYVEIVDDHGQPVPTGVAGNIVVTCLTNYAMPLVRYWIGDRGALVRDAIAGESRSAQVLQFVSGRNVDMFRTRDQKLVDGEYFTHLLYFRSWVRTFQVIQKAHEHILFRIVSTNGRPSQHELEEIAAKSRVVMGTDCRVEFEFPSDLPPHPNGKYRYTISEVAA